MRAGFPAERKAPFPPRGRQRNLAYSCLFILIHSYLLSRKTTPSSVVFLFAADDGWVGIMSRAAIWGKIEILSESPPAARFFALLCSMTKKKKHRLLLLSLPKSPFCNYPGSQNQSRKAGVKKMNEVSLKKPWISLSLNFRGIVEREKSVALFVLVSLNMRIDMEQNIGQDDCQGR